MDFLLKCRILYMFILASCVAGCRTPLSIQSAEEEFLQFGLYSQNANNLLDSYVTGYKDPNGDLVKHGVSIKNRHHDDYGQNIQSISLFWNGVVVLDVSDIHPYSTGIPSVPSFKGNGAGGVEYAVVGGLRLNSATIQDSRTDEWIMLADYQVGEVEGVRIDISMKRAEYSSYLWLKSGELYSSIFRPDSKRSLHIFYDVAGNVECVGLDDGRTSDGYFRDSKGYTEYRQSKGEVWSGVKDEFDARSNGIDWADSLARWGIDPLILRRQPSGTSR